MAMSDATSESSPTPRVIATARRRRFQKGRVSMTSYARLSAGMSDATPAEADQSAPRKLSVSSPVAGCDFSAMSRSETIAVTSRGITRDTWRTMSSMVSQLTTLLSTPTTKSRKGKSASTQ
jgi:hypothetical protein